MDLIPFNGKTYTLKFLETRTTTELVDLYNEIAPIFREKFVKKFSDRATAINRVWNMLFKTASTTVQEPVMTVEVKEKKNRVAKFNLPFSGAIKISKNDKSLRTRVLNRLTEGNATFEDVRDVVRKFDADRNLPEKNIDRRSYEIVRILHYYLGYGIKQNDDGIITLISN